MGALSEFPALAAGDALTGAPPSTDPLRQRIAVLYRVPTDCVLPTRGATHALELVLRAAARDGARTVAGAFTGLDQLAAIYGLELSAQTPAIRVIASPDSRGRLVTALTRSADEILVVDESAIEFAPADASLAPLAARTPGVVVLRSLSLAYGLRGARCGAAVAAPETLARLHAVLEPWPLPGPTIRAAEAVLSPSRALAVEGRIALVRQERRRVSEALAAFVEDLAVGDGPWFWLRTRRPVDLARFGVEAQSIDDGLKIEIGPPAANDRLLAAFGALGDRPLPRRGEAVRDTRETRIVATVDLDTPGDTRLATGLGFFDHMLEQVAAHGGFSLRLACEGDLHIDAHHTVEDCTLAFGQALKQALGDRAGIGRYGFTTPMDEASATVALDLSGRPAAVFEGTFAAERIGEYPTALTAHVFRSLADSLGAAVHVRVTGEDDHHKTEACFKALGRALRQAVSRQGGGVPSTKGVL